MGKKKKRSEKPSEQPGDSQKQKPPTTQEKKVVASSAAGSSSQVTQPPPPAKQQQSQPKQRGGQQQQGVRQPVPSQQQQQPVPPQQQQPVPPQQQPPQTVFQPRGPQQPQQRAWQAVPSQQQPPQTQTVFQPRGPQQQQQRVRQPVPSQQQPPQTQTVFQPRGPQQQQQRAWQVVSPQQQPPQTQTGSQQQQTVRQPGPSQQQQQQQPPPYQAQHVSQKSTSRSSSISEVSSIMSDVSITSKGSKKKQQKQKNIEHSGGDVKSAQSTPGSSSAVQMPLTSPQKVGDDRKGSGDVGKTRPGDDKKSASTGATSAGDQKKETQLSLKPKYTLQRTLGRRGKQIKIHTNHLELSLGNLETAVHHDVEIDPDRPKKSLLEVMEAFRLKYYPKCYPAFDGNKNLYSTRLLTTDVKTPLIGEVNIVVDDREKTYKVKVSFAAYVNLVELKHFFARRTAIPPMSAIQCIDIVLRQAPIRNFIKVGRSFFSKPSGPIIDLGDGMEMYNGFFQSAILGWKPFLNVDVSHKAFPKNERVDNLLKELYYNANDVLKDPRPLEKLIRTLKIEYQIPRNTASKRIFRVNGLSSESASRTRFKLDNGQNITITDYFKTVKNYQIQFPDLPCLWVGAKSRENKILLPMELCTVLPGQAVNSKMTENQTRNMIKYSATNTGVRRQKIANSIKEADFNRSQCVREFGLSVSEEFTQVEARILQPPDLHYDRVVRPSRGVWRVANFLEGVTIPKWTILNLDGRTRQESLNNLKQLFMQTAGKLNVKCGPPIEPFENLSRYRRIDELSNYFASRKDYNLIFVVIQDSGSQYPQVKKAAEINVGVLTQCIRSKTVFRLNPSTIENILLKVNAKLNGVNHTFKTKPKCMNRPCMLMGADVTHPAPDSDSPSVAAVIASHDPKAFKYNLCWRLQPSREEMITDLSAITREQLIYFHRKTNVKPVHLIYIRDGVSDGQFEQVLGTELTAIRQACTRLEESYKPQITFIVVQKRHHTRFFPNQKDSEDKNCNVPAGTCVDTMITSPNAQDFFLVSHASIQGVAKPTKYRVLWDDTDMHEDELEELMYHLCHMFTRCARSVSYPAPTYYAHLAAARAKAYCDAESIDLRQLNRAQNDLIIKEQIVKGLPMFFV